jgi:hypothetical protein
MRKTKTKTNPAATFHQDLQALRAKYPMVYVEVWTPEDFVVDELSVDWNHPFHETTVDNLHRHFDPEIGTNWERVRHESVS